MACDLSKTVLDELENGRRGNFSPDTIAAVEAALGWEPGSAERVRKGQEPREYEDPMLTRLRVLWARLSPDARAMLVEVAERAAPSA